LLQRGKFVRREAGVPSSNADAHPITGSDESVAALSQWHGFSESIACTKKAPPDRSGEASSFSAG